jgi:hypothetical protein
MNKRLLDPQEVRKFLDRCLTSGKIETSKEARRRMVERRFDILDARNVIRYGEIRDIAYNEEHENHQVEIVGEDIDGEGLALELALELEESLTIIITGFSPRHEKGRHSPD